MTDNDSQEQPLESDLNLSASDRAFWVRLLDAAQQSRVSLISEPEPEARPDENPSPISTPFELRSSIEEDDSSNQSPESTPKSRKLFDELCDILQRPLSTTSHAPPLNLEAPETSPAPSVYRSITPETSSDVWDPAIADYQDWSPTSERTIKARPSFARGYQELVGRYSSDWGNESTRQQSQDYPKNWPLREDTASTFPNCNTDKITPSSSACIPLSKSCPTSPFTESRPPRRRTLTNKVKNRLSKIFGDRTTTL
ncbi:hypothetical protein N7493_011936 [Penicillium malachiteum]|uniref:Uncharacterized protein n=1 Tax=Penicillium malachiteum TaxID=1324776 RepID=A0AAD6H9Z6_9EURO|nr:hypothetical protein N7493_011936 [Penicillium malachiteum]